MNQFRVSGIKIEELEVIKETEKQIVYFNSSHQECRESKSSQWAIWFKTFDDAKKHLIEKWTLHVENKENQLQSAKDNLSKVTNL